MKLRTEVNIQPYPFEINHQSKVMLMGSCFTKNIGSKMENNGFNVLCNPFGITFNPLSISRQLIEIINLKKYTTEDIDEYGGHFISYQHHSSFNRAHKYEMLVGINESIEKAHAFLKEAEVLFLSFGTAWVWGHKDNHEIVNNCHKVPLSQFEQVLTKCEHIIQEYTDVKRNLEAFNPNLKVVFTISPVRHWKSGAMENSRSKSVLISSTHDLVDQDSDWFYFPSYEIMIDDLRDYRFYTDDLIHPSDKAIEYIWKKFGDGFFNEKTLQANKAAEKVTTMLNHRPMNPESEEFEKFKAKLASRRCQLKAEYGIEL